MWKFTHLHGRNSQINLEKVQRAIQSHSKGREGLIQPERGLWAIKKAPCPLHVSSRIHRKMTQQKISMRHTAFRHLKVGGTVTWVLYDWICPPQVRVNDLNGQEWPQTCLRSLAGWLGHWQMATALYKWAPFLILVPPDALLFLCHPDSRKWSGSSKLVKRNANVTSPWFSRIHALHTRGHFVWWYPCLSFETLVGFCLPFFFFFQSLFLDLLSQCLTFTKNMDCTS